MELRHLLLLVAVIATAVYVLPVVISLFSGMHTFYSPGDSKCLKCHADIQSEVSLSSLHATFSCENCHSQIDPNQSHSGAAVIRCLTCHGTPPTTVTDKNNNTLTAPTASIFGENATALDPHSPLVASANQSPLLAGENEACIACHTQKSIEIIYDYPDTYSFNAINAYNATLQDSGWTVVGYRRVNNVQNPVSVNTSTGYLGEHITIPPANISCEKCHKDIRGQLNNSMHHFAFYCRSCHLPEQHSTSQATCLYCHGTTPRIVTGRDGNSYFSSPAIGLDSPEAHQPMLATANTTNTSRDNSEACSACHSSYNLNITYTRPSYVEWDVVDTGGTWTIQNLTYTPQKNVTVNLQRGEELHNWNVTIYIACEGCHQDINQAVSGGGHSNEQWMNRHSYAFYPTRTFYCKSCHLPQTKNLQGQTPYPDQPFNLQVHAALPLSCLDCHNKTDLLVNINGGWKTPPYNSTAMGGIEASISQQPKFVQAYLCLACKNTGNPTPPVHFQVYTEPDTRIFVNGTQQYP